VVTPLGSFLHPRNLVNGKESFERINAACKEGNSTLYATGLDPGYTDCVLGATVASLVGDITQIRTYEVLDYSSYRYPETLSVMGFGGKPEELPDMGQAILGYWGGSVYTTAEGCGLELDEVTFSGDIWTAPETYTAKNGLTVEAGTVGAVRFWVSGVAGGEERLQLHHINRMGANAAPDWPAVGETGGYRVEVDGFPPIKADFPFGLPGGTGDALEDGVSMAAARLINSIDAVVAAPPGHMSTNDLPLIGPRFGMAGR
jgi:2,4-diaminopentanoate dehydrogenase